MSSGDEFEPLVATRSAPTLAAKNWGERACVVKEFEHRAPRLELPRLRKHQRRSNRNGSAGGVCALSGVGRYSEASKAQIDCLERLLHSGMPPRLQLENAFAGLRASVADDIETTLEEQWKAGVKHGEWLAQNRQSTEDFIKIRELENKVVEVMSGKAALERTMGLNNCREALGQSPVDELDFLFSGMEEGRLRPPHVDDLDVEALVREMHYLDTQILCH